MNIKYKGFKMNMLFILCATLMLTAKSSNAELEVAFYSKYGNYTYVDYSSRFKKGDAYTMLSMVDLKTPEFIYGKNIKSYKSVAKYDCKRQRMRFLSNALYSEHIGQGVPIFAKPDDDSRWTQLQDGSTGLVLWKIACGLLRPH